MIFITTYITVSFIGLFVFGFINSTLTGNSLFSAICTTISILMLFIFSTEIKTEHEVSIKSDVVLDRHEYTMCENQSSCSMMIQPKRSISIKEMKWYTTRQLVSCLDAIRENNPIVTKKTHLAFVGDSRIRNQFLNLIQVLMNIII